MMPVTKRNNKSTVFLNKPKDSEYMSHRLERDSDK